MNHLTSAKDLASEILEEMRKKNNYLKAKYKLVPGLAVIKIGHDPASEIYVNNKVKTSQDLGINSFRIDIEANIAEKNVIRKIQLLNHDPKVHGILIQLPLPFGFDSLKILEEVDPKKDVDGLHPINVGKLSMGVEGGLIACTPLGCILLLKRVLNDLSGLHAVVVGRSNLVGKPMAQLLLRENCTVTICNSKTKNLKDFTSKADILVVATGRPKLITKEHVKEGAVVLDVGVNRLADGKLCGDVDYDNVVDKVKFITPVPGGIGRMTIACLMMNTIKATCLSKEINFDTLEYCIKHNY